MTLARNDQDWAVLLNEYNICKKKLESKREGLKILLKELEQAQIEQDRYKNKITQLQTELQDVKEVLHGCWKDDGSLTIEFGGSDDKKIKSLSNLLQFSRDENLRLQHDLDNLRQLYGESQRDNQLLRAALSKHEAQKRVGLHDKHDKEKLIFQLEEALSKITVLEQELQLRGDEKKELEEERTSFRDKNSRLNAELNYILHNDDKRIVDIDAMVLENQYLKEVVKQYKEEKSMALGTAARYKEALRQTQHSPPNKNTLSCLDLASPTRNQHHEGFFSRSFDHNTVSDLQRVNKAITEKLSEKDVALKHQRNTNRVLGTRVSELEKKLKTLEISGLWSHEQRVPRNLPEMTEVAIQPIVVGSNEILQPAKADYKHNSNNNNTDHQSDESRDNVALSSLSSNSETIKSKDGLTHVDSTVVQAASTLNPSNTELNDVTHNGEVEAIQNGLKDQNS